MSCLYEWAMKMESHEKAKEVSDYLSEIGIENCIIVDNKLYTSSEGNYSSYKMILSKLKDYVMQNNSIAEVEWDSWESSGSSSEDEKLILYPDGKEEWQKLKQEAKEVGE